MKARDERPGKRTRKEAPARRGRPRERPMPMVSEVIEWEKTPAQVILAWGLIIANSAIAAIIVIVQASLLGLVEIIIEIILAVFVIIYTGRPGLVAWVIITMDLVISITLLFYP